MLSEQQIHDIAAVYSKDPHWFEFEANDFIAAARAIEQASRATALEEAKRICDEEAARQWSRYKGDGPERGDGYIEGLADGSERCGTLIDRALTKQGETE